MKTFLSHFPPSKLLAESSTQHLRRYTPQTLHPTNIRHRGGRNLSRRDAFIRSSSEIKLEDADALDAEAAHRVRQLSPIGQHTPASASAAARLAVEDQQYTLAHDVRIPVKPKPPGSEDCCMSGCAVCVSDLYADSLQTYRERLAFAKTQLSERRVPKEQWPPEVRAEAAGGVEAIQDPREAQMDANISAFLALEKKLEEKHA